MCFRSCTSIRPACSQGVGEPVTSVAFPAMVEKVTAAVSIYLSIYLKSQDYGDIGAEAQQGRLTSTNLVLFCNLNKKLNY